MEVVEQIRQAASIVEVASQYTTLKRRGSKHVGLCPFHAEKTPSFTVDEDKQLYHCFGCNAGGDVFSLVMDKEQISFPEALKYLADKYHVQLPKKPGYSPQAQKLEEQVLEIHERALAFFRRSLTGTPEGARALAYLKKRGLGDETVQTFQLGYAPNAWDALITHFKAWKTPPALLEKAGLALPGKKPGEYYDRFRGRAIFPIFNASGKTVAFGGRALFDQDPKYLNSPDTPIYTKGKLLYGLNFSKDALRETGEAVLVEGYTDYIAVFQAGLTNVVASLGTALTLPQLGLIERFAGRVVINYDGDAAGRQAAQRAVTLCFEKGLPSRVLVLPDGLDPDGAMKALGPDRYRELLARAVPGFRYFVGGLTRGKDMGVPEEKARVVKQVLEEIARVPDPVMRGDYIKQTAELLAVDEPILRAMSAGSAGPAPVEEGCLFSNAEQSLLQILIRHRPIARYVYAEMREDDVRGLPSEPILRLVRESHEAGKDWVYAEVRPRIEARLAAALDRALLKEEQAPTVEQALDCLYTLREMQLAREEKAVCAKIRECERSGERERMAGLNRRRHEISNERIALRTRKPAEP
jgi:DNA primase